MSVFEDASALLIRSILSFLFLLIPAAAMSVLAARKGVRDTVLLGSIALASTALAGYVIFFLFFVSSVHIVRPLGNACTAAAAACLLFYFPKLSTDARAALKPLVAPALLVFTSALLFLSWTYVYGGIEQPLLTPMGRFSHMLPGDNSLPYLLLYGMMNLTHTIPHPILSDWLASDRPPLQTAIALAQYSALLVPMKLGYQVLSVILQCLWIYGLWLLLYAAGVRRQANACLLLASICTNFALVQSVFVWPKMLAAAYMLGFAALLLNRRLSRSAPFSLVAILTAGTLLGWAFLSHGGSLFALLGLLPTALLFRRMASLKKLVAALGITAFLFLPWTLFQKYIDPPGNRILKMHLAGVFPIDERSAGEAIHDSYKALSRTQLVANKTTNLRLAFTHFEFWGHLRELLLGPNRRAAAKAMNETQFFYFGSTTGFFLPGLAALLIGVLPRFRSVEWHLGVLCWTFVIITNVLWSLVMFGPESTVVHQGSYVPVLLAFTGGMLGFWSVSRWLAYAVMTVQVCLFGYIHIALLSPEGGVLNPWTASLSAVMCLATGALIYKLSQPPASGTRPHLHQPSL